MIVFLPKNSTCVLPGYPDPKIFHGDILKSMFGLLRMAKPDDDAIEEFQEIPFFMQRMGIAHCPASSTLR